MDAIDETLATSALSSKHSPALQAALSMGKKTLNRYYEKTDLANTYRIAMGTPFSLTFLPTVPAFPLLFSLTALSFQFFILGTSSVTSKQQSGRTTGSRPPGSLYAPSSTFRTDIPPVSKRWHPRMRCVLPQVFFYVLRLLPNIFCMYNRSQRARI
jgi:hypothetical protein